MIGGAASHRKAGAAEDYDPHSAFEVGVDAEVPLGFSIGERTARAGIFTIAREFIGSPIQVLVLESGQLTETPRATDLNTVESIGEPKGEAEIRRRIEWHGAGSSSWSQQAQPYGVRCRVLGGSSHAWAGKVAAFDSTDFAKRDWIPYSGWPFTLESLTPFIDRAAVTLNLGPNCYDSEFWSLLGLKTPPAGPDPQLLRSFFWQIARSRLDSGDIMRFGPEFVTLDAPNVRVLVNATVTSIDTNAEGSAFDGLEVSTIDGVRSRVRAKAGCWRRAPSKIRACCSRRQRRIRADWAMRTIWSADS